MRELNPEHIKKVLQEINQAPFLQLICATVQDIGPRFSRVQVNLSKQHMNPLGSLHGGLHASLIDTAAYWAVYCSLPENVGMITIDLDINYFATSKANRLIVEGISIKIGRSLCMAEAVVKDETGKLLAHGTSKLMVGEKLPSISQAVISKGHQPLPPKFL